MSLFVAVCKGSHSATEVSGRVCQHMAQLSEPVREVKESLRCLTAFSVVGAWILQGEAFDLVRDFPESAPALLDLRRGFFSPRFETRKGWGRS